ncbi:MAG: TrbI/VirB10 family protein [Acidobacteria bacterium]|nr:TrbI/VirB10 family protein [Acidobacteriota bacterium]
MGPSEEPAAPREAPPAPPNENPAATAAPAAAAVEDAGERQRAELAAAAAVALEEASREREDPEAQQRERDRRAAEAALRATGWPLEGGPPPELAGQYAPGPYASAPYHAAPLADVDAEFALQQRRAMQASLSSPPVAHSVRSQDPALPPPPNLAAEPPPPLPLGPLPDKGGVPEDPAPDEAAPDLPAAVPRPEPGPGMEVIDEGSIAEAVLQTEIRADFAGPVMALVNIPMWSRDRQRVLIPRGTKALGSAGPVQGWGQSRLAVGFHRLILPSGERVELAFQGLSQTGAASLKDRVNRHYLSTFGAAGAVGLVSGLSQIGAQRPTLATPGDARFVAGQRMGDAAGEIFQRYLNRPPSITIRAGHRVRIYFASDAAVPRRFPPG